LPFTLPDALLILMHILLSSFSTAFQSLILPLVLSGIRPPLQLQPLSSAPSRAFHFTAPPLDLLPSLFYTIRRRLKTLLEPAHTPEESIRAAGLGVDNTQPTVSTSSSADPNAIQKWSAKPKSAMTAEEKGEGEMVLV
jgi:hypothetical protein